MNKRNFLFASASAALAPLLGGCDRVFDWLDKNEELHFEWTEDVALKNGRTLVVKRSARLLANDIAGGGGGSYNKGMTLDIVSPEEDDLPVTWSDVYVPLLLERNPLTKEWILIATFFHCDEWYRLGRPSVPYTQYRYEKKGWQRQALSEEYIGRLANLYIADRRPKTAHLTIAGKKAFIEEHPGISKEYLMVVGNWSSSC